MKLAVFDLGRVLVDFDFSIAIRRLQERGPLNLARVEELFRHSDLAARWDKGLLSGSEFFREIRSELKLAVSQDEFMSMWNEIFEEVKEPLELARSVARSGRAVILSNTNPWHVAYIRRKYRWVKEFRALYASCDLKLLKPDPAIYRRVLEDQGVRPEEAFYTDDIPGYAEAARKVGMDAEVFTDAPSLRRQLEARGFLGGT